MSYTIQLSDEQLSNVSHVLFGNQKQASVINKAVVKIVAKGLINVAGDSCLNSQEAIISTAKGYLQKLCDNGFSGDETFIMLLCGTESLACLKETGPKMVHVNQPNVESPKHNFRVTMLGENPEIDRSAELSDSAASNATALPSSTSCPYEPTDDFPTRARKIKDAILPLCPEVLKHELSDEYAQALCMAEYYYKNVYTGNSTVSAPESTKPAVDEQTVKGICEMWRNGSSGGEISSKYNLEFSVVKQILKDKGFTMY